MTTGPPMMAMLESYLKLTASPNRRFRPTWPTSTHPATVRVTLTSRASSTRL